MRAFVLILFFCLVAGCSPQKRLQRLLSNNPELQQTAVKPDTLTVYHVDTFTTEAWELDTFFSLLTDTVFTVMKDSNKISIRKDARNHFLLDVLFPPKQFTSPDTIRVPYLDTIRTVNYTPITTEEKWQYRKDGMMILGGVLLFLLLIVVLIKVYV